MPPKKHSEASSSSSKSKRRSVSNDRSRSSKRRNESGDDDDEEGEQEKEKEKEKSVQQHKRAKTTRPRVIEEDEDEGEKEKEKEEKKDPVDEDAAAPMDQASEDDGPDEPKSDDRKSAKQEAKKESPPDDDKDNSSDKKESKYAEDLSEEDAKKNQQREIEAMTATAEAMFAEQAKEEEENRRKRAASKPDEEKKKMSNGIHSDSKSSSSTMVLHRNPTIEESMLGFPSVQETADGFKLKTVNWNTSISHNASYFANWRKDIRSEFRKVSMKSKKAEKKIKMKWVIGDTRFDYLHEWSPFARLCFGTLKPEGTMVYIGTDQELTRLNKISSSGGEFGANTKNPYSHENGANRSCFPWCIETMAPATETTPAYDRPNIAFCRHRFQLMKKNLLENIVIPFIKAKIAGSDGSWPKMRMKERIDEFTKEKKVEDTPECQEKLLQFLFEKCNIGWTPMKPEDRDKKAVLETKEGLLKSKYQVFEEALENRQTKIIINWSQSMYIKVKQNEDGTFWPSLDNKNYKYAVDFIHLPGNEDLLDLYENGDQTIKPIERYLYVPPRIVSLHGRVPIRHDQIEIFDDSIISMESDIQFTMDAKSCNIATKPGSVVIVVAEMAPKSTSFEKIAYQSTTVSITPEQAKYAYVPPKHLAIEGPQRLAIEDGKQEEVEKPLGIAARMRKRQAELAGGGGQRQGGGGGGNSSAVVPFGGR